MLVALSLSSLDAIIQRKNLQLTSKTELTTMRVFKYDLLKHAPLSF